MLESLPNELLIELFEFLDAVELFQAFYNLNSRFNTLILTHTRAYRIGFSTVFKNQYNHFYRRHLPSIIDRVISFRLADNNDKRSTRTLLFLSYDLHFNQFTHLRSLALCYINCDTTLRNLLNDCRDIPLLIYLKIFLCDSSYMSSTLFSNSIWRFPKLTHFRLKTRRDFFMPTIVSSSLEYLSISCQNFGLSQVSGLFRQTPSLQRLHAPLNNLNDNRHLVLSTLSSLTILKLSNVRSSYSMINVLRAVPNLTHLKIDTYYINWNGYQWETIIDDHLPKLKVFRLRMHIDVQGEQNNDKHIDDLVNSFRTRFWLEKYHSFIRCHERLEDTYRSIILYTLPYTFDKVNLHLFREPYKTTCPGDNGYGIRGNQKKRQKPKCKTRHFSYQKNRQ
jgi:hypothetical protein